MFNQNQRMISSIKIKLFFTVLFSIIFTYSFAGEIITGKVIKVADGDTVTILTPANQQIRVRLNCIDAPEKKQAFGQKAKQSLSDLVFGKTVEVEKHDIDRYGRIVGTVYLNGLDINLVQVERGYAWVYKQYCSNNIYYEAENIAKSKQIGLWSQPNPIPPWAYRRNSKPQRIDSSFTCGSKRYCNQMLSCDEAMFYINICGLKRLDSDHDGIPCENLCR